jgi:hypothetical protein
MSYDILGPEVISAQLMNHWRKCILQLWLIQFTSSQIRYVTKATRWICLKFCCYGRTAIIQKINSVFNKTCLKNVSAVFRRINAINIMRIAYQFKVIGVRNISDKMLWRMSNGATVRVTKALKASSVKIQLQVWKFVFYLQLTFIQHHLHLKANIY